MFFGAIILKDVASRSCMSMAVKTSSDLMALNRAMVWRLVGRFNFVVIVNIWSMRLNSFDTCIQAGEMCNDRPNHVMATSMYSTESIHGECGTTVCVWCYDVIIVKSC